MFGFTEVKLGLIPAVISPFVMMKIGKGNCSRYFLTGTPPPSLAQMFVQTSSACTDRLKPDSSPLTSPIN